MIACMTDLASRRVSELLSALDNAQDAHDWKLLGQLASDIIRLDPKNEDATAFLRIAERRGLNNPERAPQRSLVGRSSELRRLREIWGRVLRSGSITAMLALAPTSQHDPAPCTRKLVA